MAWKHAWLSSKSPAWGAVPWLSPEHLSGMAPGPQFPLYGGAYGPHLHTSGGVGCLFPAQETVVRLAAVQGQAPAARNLWVHSLAVFCTQDNQTDSGMVLASEEFEQLESRHRQEGGLR